MLEPGLELVKPFCLIFMDIFMSSSFPQVITFVCYCIWGEGLKTLLYCCNHLQRTLVCSERSIHLDMVCFNFVNILLS